MPTLNVSPNRRASSASAGMRAAAAATVAALASATLSGCGAADVGTGGRSEIAGNSVAGETPTEQLQEGKTLNQSGLLGDSGNTSDASGKPGDESSLPVNRKEQLANADASPKTTRPAAPARLAVTGLQTSSHEGFDRVVVNLDGDGEPGWFADYVPSPTQQTVGTPLEVKGSAFLNVYVDGTVYPQDIGRSDVDANHAEGTGSIVEVVNAGTSGGRSQIVIGLKSNAPYFVRAVENPTRLVIDIVRS